MKPLEIRALPFRYLGLRAFVERQNSLHAVGPAFIAMSIEAADREIGETDGMSRRQPPTSKDWTGPAPRSQEVGR